jgi:hypothetical protein
VRFGPEKDLGELMPADSMALPLNERSFGTPR